MWVIKVAVGESFFLHDASFVRGAAGTFHDRTKVMWIWVQIQYRSFRWTGLQRNPTVRSAIVSLTWTLVAFVHEPC